MKVRSGSLLGIKLQIISFLDLPAEVRNLIYKAALVTGEIALDPKKQSDNFRILAFYSLPTIVGILRTCKFVHNEALPILYSRNEFSFLGNATNQDHMYQLLGNDTLKHITTLHLDTLRITYPWQIMSYYSDTEQ